MEAIMWHEHNVRHFLRHPSLKIVNVTRAVKMPSDLHENSFQKTSITANSEQALRNRCCLVDFDTNSNKWSLGRSSHRVSKDAESQQGKPLNVKTPRRGISLHIYPDDYPHNHLQIRHSMGRDRPFSLPDNEAPLRPPSPWCWLNPHSVLLISSRPLWIRTLKCRGSSQGFLWDPWKPISTTGPGAREEELLWKSKHKSEL